MSLCITVWHQVMSPCILSMNFRTFYVLNTCYNHWNRYFSIQELQTLMINLERSQSLRQGWVSFSQLVILRKDLVSGPRTCHFLWNDHYFLHVQFIHQACTNVAMLQQKCHTNVSWISRYCRVNVALMSRECRVNVAWMSRECRVNDFFCSIATFKLS